MLLGRALAPCSPARSYWNFSIALRVPPNSQILHSFPVFEAVKLQGHLPLLQTALSPCSESCYTHCTYLQHCFASTHGAKLCWTAPEALLLQQPRVRVGPYAEFPCSLFPVLLLPAAPVSQRAAAAVWRWLFLDSFMIHRTNFCLLWNLTVVMGLEVYIKSTNLVVGWAPAMVPWCTTLDIQTGLFVEDFLSTWRLWPRGKFSLGNMTLQRNHL